MGKESVREIFEYLQRLAPSFFGTGMRSASLEEIARLEDLAGTQFTESHREFLTHIGATPAQDLNPFLNDRDYCVETLLEAYAELEEEGERLPANIVYFSSSDILGENIFLRHAQSLDIDPEIGDIRFETNEFIPREVGRFESYLRWFAFVFRISQPEYQLELIPPWDEAENNWHGEPDKCWELLEGLGFRQVFILDDGTRCVDSGDVAAMISFDGSGTLAGDEFRDLRKIQAVLLKHLSIQIRPKPESFRMRAPRL